MAESFGSLDGDFIDLEVPWSMERVQELAEEIVNTFARAVDQPGPNFTVELTPDHVQFIGKAMVVQIAMMKMWREHKESRP